MKASPATIGLGVTMTIGYGTLYYSFSVLAPEIAREFGWGQSFVFGVFSFGLLAGAVLAGVLAQVSGAGQDVVNSAQDLGATVGARRFSKDFELEADSLGTEIAFVAGYDPMLGAAFFDRIPDPGDRFLGTHPANADRKRTVAATLARLGG